MINPDNVSNSGGLGGRLLGWAALLGILISLPFQASAQSIPQSKTDLWDISQGAVVTGTSGANYPYSDAQDMFGGQFSQIEPGNTVFDNNKPGGFVHYIEWQTPVPVTVGAFALFAAGDGPEFFYEREFTKFVLMAKSSADATNYDLTLYTLDVTNHPYVWLDSVSMALLATNITPVTAQYFRAEFTQYTAGRGYDSPRVIELDGYTTAAPEIVSQPAGQTVAAGADATFTVGVNGLGPFYYQWQLNGDPLPLETNATLMLPAVQTSQSGNLYSVTISNVISSTNSTAALLTVNPPGPAYLPSTNDLWDISQGSVVTGTSGANEPYSDIHDMFGARFSPVEPGNTVFDNNQPDGFVHYVEWQTPGPVTVNSFAMFAAGDGPQYLNEREFSKFVLKASSGTNATNYDLTLYDLDVTNHPCTFADPANQALVVTNITPVTAQYFRAEFTQYTAGRGYDSPRIIELDGFGTRDYTNLPPQQPPPVTGPPHPPHPPLPPPFPGAAPPTFTNSIPIAISIAARGGNIIVSWPVSPAVYVLEGADAPHAASWTEVAAMQVTNSPSVSVTIPASNAPRFFRLHLP